MSIKDYIYHKSPIFVQNMMCSAYGFIENKKRFGPHFWEMLAFLRSSDFYRQDQILAYKKERLASLLMHLTRHGYYGQFLDSWDHYRILESPFECLMAVPVTEKHVVRENVDLFSMGCDTAFPINTSGTTGSSLTFQKSIRDMSAQTAAWFRHRQRFGVSVGDLSVNFTGKVIVDPSQKKPPFWRFNRAWNQYIVNMQSINERNIGYIVDFLNELQPAFYSGYPSIIGDLSRLALKKQLRLKKSAVPKVVCLGAENMLVWQEQAIREWLNTSITDLYGLSEGACNLSKCQFGYYHEDFELCHSELIDVEVLPGGRKRGKLVGTGFCLEAFPLLRYDTGDVATMMAPEFKCGCGRDGTVYETIEGREDDYIITPAGSRIMRIDYLFKDTTTIKEVQAEQTSDTQVLFRIVKLDGYDPKRIEPLLIERYKRLVSTDMDLIFEYVDFIPKTATGKFKALVGLNSNQHTV